MKSAEWPALSFPDWEKTCDTVHLWTQIVGKTRMAFEPLQNHWWNVALYVTPTGLMTSTIPCGGRTFAIDFEVAILDFCQSTYKAPAKLARWDRRALER